MSELIKLGYTVVQPNKVDLNSKYYLENFLLVGKLNYKCLFRGNTIEFRSNGTSVFLDFGSLDTKHLNVDDCYVLRIKNNSDRYPEVLSIIYNVSKKEWYV